ncbi:hypothetical protein JAAARDRAFT_53314 [Jaapia argillacea MUCL 33604]|uniref:Uncharacterized protein n=1 Tax=Jaapia argillacea MUCL 33604 TaxID=933084 RepID=A0A067QHU6_9AGAM|nr:hypothetical protein JAAARDRAFT_53314 [Jaapia argillacea MUCL 33604]
MSSLLQPPRGLSISCLPTEILTEIMIIWARVDVDAPWVASLVSRLWRDIALSTPQVWSRIWFSLKATSIVGKEEEFRCMEDEDDVRGKARPLSLWLERTGQLTELSLTIQIDRNTIRPDRFTSYNISLIETIAMFRGYMHRLTDFELIADSSEIANYVVYSFLKATPPSRLSTLTIDCVPNSRAFDTERGWDLVVGGLWAALDQAGFIKSLVLRGCLPPKPLPTPESASPSRITSLNLIGSSRLYHIESFLLPGIAACPALEHLTIQHISTIGPLPRDIPLHSLRCLHLHYLDPSALEVLLASIRAPHLHSLSIIQSRQISATDGPKSETWRRVGKGFQRFAENSPSLEKLSLARIDILDVQLVAALGSLHWLRELCLRELFVSRVALAPLSRLGTPLRAEVDTSIPRITTVLCPHLERVRFERCPLLTGDMLCELVAARSSASSTQKLLLLGVHKCNSVNSEDIAIVRQVDSQLMVEYSPSSSIAVISGALEHQISAVDLE